MIRATDRVATVLSRDEKLIEVFVKASPTFEKLRNTALRRTMAKLVTVEQAARIAGIDATALVAHLNHALSEDAPNPEFSEPQKAVQVEFAPLPLDLVATPLEQLSELDVREDLRAGREPFRRILDAARAVPVGGVLRLRAIFEPAPLYGVLAKQGFEHFTERLASDDFRVWFRRSNSTPSAPSTSATEKAEAKLDDDYVVLDVRDLEPPEPMMRTLEALAELAPGKTLVQLNLRVPQFLLPKLEERGFSYEIHEQADVVRLFIRHK